MMVQSSGGRGSMPDFFQSQLQMSGVGHGGVNLNQGSGSRTGSGMLVSGQLPGIPETRSGFYLGAP